MNFAEIIDSYVNHDRYWICICDDAPVELDMAILILAEGRFPMPNLVDGWEHICDSDYVSLNFSFTSRKDCIDIAGYLFSHEDDSGEYRAMGF